MNTLRLPLTLHGLACAVLAISLGTGASLQAASITWDAGEAPVTNWITAGFQNWTGDSTPVGNDVIFDATGSTASASTVTNTVNQNTSITSLTYQYNSTTNYQVTDISSGVTLSVGGTANVFTVGGLFQASPITTTKTVITGLGTLDINQSGGTVFLGNNTSASGVPSILDLNMSGLSTFNANLGSTGNFRVGTSELTLGATTASGSAATVYLADTNAITSALLSVGSDVGNVQRSLTGTSTLYLGRDNTINSTTIHVGRGYAATVNGAMKFDPGVLGSSPTVKLRGANGTSAVTDFYIGVNQLNSSASQVGLVDFSGGSVDALITNLIIGQGINNNTANAHAEGKLTMDQGQMQVTSTTLGVVGGAGGAANLTPSTGILEVNGGTFTTASLILGSHVGSAASVQRVSGTLNISGSGAVSVSGAGGIVMGQHTAASTAIVSSTINLTGGSLTVNGNIAKGTNPTGVTSLLNLDGGTLEMNNNAISVDTFTAASGTLRNLNQLNSGGTLTKTTSDTLTVAGANSYTGATVIDGGILLVSGTHTGGGAYSVNNSGTLSGAGTITTAGNAGVTVAAGGKLAPGSTSGGLKLDLGTGSLDISGGITAASSQSLLFTLDTINDKISLTNASSSLDIGSGLLNFDDFVFTAGGGFTSGDYTLFDTGSTIAGTLGSDLTGTVGGYAATLHFGNSNQDLIITVVPEPTQTALLGMGGVGLLLWRLRRAFRKLA